MMCPQAHLMRAQQEDLGAETVTSTSSQRGRQLRTTGPRKAKTRPRSPMRENFHSHPFWFRRSMEVRRNLAPKTNQSWQRGANAAVLLVNRLEDEIAAMTTKQTEPEDFQKERRTNASKVEATGPLGSADALPRQPGSKATEHQSTPSDVRGACLADVPF